DGTAASTLTQCVRTLQATRPGRLVIDLSRVSSVDFAGSRALLAAARPTPGQSPVVVRAVPVAARQRLEFLGLDLGQPDWDGRPADGGPPGWQRNLEDSATAILVREWRHLQGSAERAAADARQTQQRLAATEDRIATTLDRIVVRRLAEAAH